MHKVSEFQLLPYLHQKGTMG